MKKKRGANTHLIYFFGTHDYAWVHFPNEVVPEGKTKRRRSTPKNSFGDPDRNLFCRCFCFVSSESSSSPVALDETGSRKRKKSDPGQFPIHLFSCKEYERRRASSSPEFLSACEEVSKWLNQNPEEWFFKEFDPVKDSDDEDSDASEAKNAVVSLATNDEGVFFFSFSMANII